MIQLLKKIFGWSKKEEPLCPALPETKAENKTVPKSSKKKSKKAKKKSSKKKK